MGHEFDRDVEVARVDDGTFSATLSAGWHVGGGINGGYQMAVLGSALRGLVPGKPDPITMSTYFLTPATAGEAQVRTRILRDGGSIATLAADLVQDGQVRISAMATYGDLAALPSDVRTTAVPPDLPPVEECFSTMDAPEELKRMAPLLERFDLRLDPTHAGWTSGTPSGEGAIQGWFAFQDGREPDPLSLLLVLDALPPATFDLGLPGWAPTLELTAHVRARPVPGWLRVRHATRNVAGGMFEEDCEVWDAAGRLVAQARQLARVPRTA